MDRPSATEMKRERASEMDRQTKCHKNKNFIEMDENCQTPDFKFFP